MNSFQVLDKDMESFQRPFPVIDDSHSHQLSLSMLDIGGALGLILGLSVQSLVSTISKNIKRLEHKTSRQRFITALIKFYDRRFRNPKYKNGNFL